MRRVVYLVAAALVVAAVLTVLTLSVLRLTSTVVWHNVAASRAVAVLAVEHRDVAQGELEPPKHVLLVPMYKTNTPLSTIEKRRRYFWGWVFATCLGE